MKRKYIKTLAFGMALTCAVPAMAQNKVVQGLSLIHIFEAIRKATDDSTIRVLLSVITHLNHAVHHTYIKMCIRDRSSTVPCTTLF